MAKDGAKAKNYCDSESVQTLQSYVLPGHGYPADKPSYWSLKLLIGHPGLKSEPNIERTLHFLARFNGWS